MKSTDMTGSADEIVNTQVSSDIQKLSTSEEIHEVLNSRTMQENLDAGFKIMGIGMIAVFGVLFILYAVIKIMGKFVKTEKKAEN